MEAKNRRILGLALNLTIVVFECIGFAMCLAERGWMLLKMYTQDSNLVALAACGTMAASQLLCLRGKREKPAEWVRIFKFVAVCLLAITLLVVLMALGPGYTYSDRVLRADGLAAGKYFKPGYGYADMLLKGAMLYHHLLCPIFAIGSFLLAECEEPLPRRAVPISLLPTVLYAAVMIVLNLCRVVWGPYPFLRVYSQPVYISVLWFCLILGAAGAIALVLRALGARRAAALHRQRRKRDVV